MTTYQLRPEAYEAVQFNGLNSIEEICEMLETQQYTLSSGVIENPGKLELRFPAHLFDIVIVKGDYVVRHPNGGLAVMSAYDFRQKYQVIK